jgi:hypothetical protein
MKTSKTNSIQFLTAINAVNVLLQKPFTLDRKPEANLFLKSFSPSLDSCQYISDKTLFQTFTFGCCILLRIYLTGSL